MKLGPIADNVKHLRQLLNMDSLTEVVDIGANPIDGTPPYRKLLDAGLCRVTGFEPQKSALDKLLKEKGTNETYLPYAVGDGKEHTLYLYQSTGLVSFFELDPSTLDVFRQLKPAGRLRGTEAIQTKRLDDIKEIRRIDFLKIDIQGSELSVFRHGRRSLSNTAVIQTEVSFMPIYKNQPTIGDIDLELRAQGFVPHCFAMPYRTGPIAPMVIENDPWRGLNQLGEADLVYVKDFRKADELESDLIKHMALLASGCWRSADLTFRCLWMLVDRKEIDRDAPARYLSGQ